MGAQSSQRQVDKMQKKVNLVPLLLLGCVCTLHGVPVTTDPLYPTQENFDLSRMMGKWYTVANGNTKSCSHKQHLRGEVAISSLVLETGGEGNIMMTKTGLRHGKCKQFTADYQMTDTPGRFSFQKFGVNVDGYVVHTNYDEYAIVIITMSPGRNKTSVKLLSRTMEVRETVLDDFKTLVRELGMIDDNIVISKNKGECDPGEQDVIQQVSEPEPQRFRRSVVPLLMVPAEEEGSGMEDAPLFKGAESCKAVPDAGPCFGMAQNFFYNSSSMSCQMFTYGGCLGNQNNFATERECLQTCRTEAVCRLPMAAFPCKGQLPVWAFDSTSGLCLAYKQGFCQGNGNKFYSKAECEEYCGVVKDEEILTVS